MNCTSHFHHHRIHFLSFAEPDLALAQLGICCNLFSTPQHGVLRLITEKLTCYTCITVQRLFSGPLNFSLRNLRLHTFFFNEYNFITTMKLQRVRAHPNFRDKNSRRKRRDKNENGFISNTEGGPMGQIVCKRVKSGRWEMGFKCCVLR